MSIFKCKMCGGTIEFNSGDMVGTCDSCGSVQTLPKGNDEVITNLFNRANKLRIKAEFDKAAEIYEKIVDEDNSNAEAHWGLVLCKYGIEYVEDPASHKRVPTCHRAQYESVMTDADYIAALENSDTTQQGIYTQQAIEISGIQKGILAIVKDEKPFDVFICYKETDENGKRTIDSSLANDIYYQLTQEGLKVFYAAITLEDKLGQEYEPYIFAALNSAKVMLVVGTKPEYFEAVWVKNEWSRFLKIMSADRSKLLIPCYRDMDAYDLPEEFAHLQAQDMSKIGFVNDVVRGIKKVIDCALPKTETVVVNNASVNTNVVALKKRGFMALEDGEWKKADEFFEEALNQDAENAECYLGKLMAELKIKTRESLKDYPLPFDDKNNYIKASKFNAEIAEKLKADNEFIRERNELNRKEGIYSIAQTKMNNAVTDDDFNDAASKFESIPDFKDSDKLREICLEKAEIAFKEELYNDARNFLDPPSGYTEQDYISAAESLETISGYKDSDKLKEEFLRRAEKAHEDAIIAEKNAIYESAISKMTGEYKPAYIKAITLFESIIDWKDSRAKIDECNNKIREIEIAEEERDQKIEEYRKIEEIKLAKEKSKAKIKKVVKYCLISAILIVFLVTALFSAISLHDYTLLIIFSGPAAIFILSFILVLISIKKNK